MSIKLIALDMDGTLMNSKSELSEGNRKALEKAMKAGILVVPATGRVYSTLPDSVKSLPGVKYVLSSNGAAVYRVGEQKPIYTHFMSVEKALEVYKAIKEVHCIKEFYINGYGYLEKQIIDSIDTFDILPAFRKYYGVKKFAVDNIEEFIKQNKQGVEKINLPWITTELRNQLLQCLAPIEGLAVTSSLGENIELNCEGAHKGDGLRGLCKVIGLDMLEVMACGDGCNDLEMIMEAGYGIAMANGHEQVKQKANFVTLSNDEDGVAYAIEKFCFGK